MHFTHKKSFSSGTKCNVISGFYCTNRNVHACGQSEDKTANEASKEGLAAVIPETIVYALNGEEITLKPLLW